MALSDQQVLELFEKSGGVLKGHFLLTSGRHSDTYMQCALLFDDARVSEALCKELAERVKKYQPDIIVSPATGAIIMGYEVSRHLGVKNLFAERENGKFTLRRGFTLPKNAKVLITENVVTTGGSVFEVIDMLKEYGAEIVAVASMVDRSNGSVDFGVPFVTMLRADVKSYEADECPLCKAGMGAPIKPGSRNLK